MLHEEARRFRAPLGAIFLRKLPTEPKSERNLRGSDDGEASWSREINQSSKGKE